MSHPGWAVPSDHSYELKALYFNPVGDNLTLGSQIYQENAKKVVKAHFVVKFRNTQGFFGEGMGPKSLNR